MIMRGAIAASRLGIFQSYIHEIYRNMWAEPKKMDDPTVFRTVLTDAGFDAQSILRLIETREIKDELLHNAQRSVEHGTFGSPTFYVGNEIFFGKDRLHDLEEEIIRMRARP
jgi:2-hydroxychromene-2-carboxylate isomerase